MYGEPWRSRIWKRPGTGGSGTGAANSGGSGGGGDQALPINGIVPELEIQDEVAIDHHMGLMWAREQRGDAEVDGRGEFQPEDSKQPQAAVALAAQYCDGMVLAGFDDWRLPTRLELFNLVDHERCNKAEGPALNHEAFPTAELGTFRTPYWTSTPHFAEYQYAIGFLMGRKSRYQICACATPASRHTPMTVATARRGDLRLSPVRLMLSLMPTSPSKDAPASHLPIALAPIAPQGLLTRPSGYLNVGRARLVHGPHGGRQRLHQAIRRRLALDRRRADPRTALALV